MTGSIGQAAGHLGARGATSAVAPAEDRGAGHAFEREFERAMVETWFAAGPVIRLAPPPGGPTGRGATIADRLTAARGATSAAADRGAVESHGGDRRPDDTTRTEQRRGAERADGPVAEPAPRLSRAPTPSAAPAVTPVVSPAAAPASPAAASPSPGSMPRPATASAEPVAVAALPIGAAALPSRFLTARVTGLGTEPAPLPGPRPRGPANPPPPPIRLHVEGDANGARVWLGVDRAAQTASSAVVEHVREALNRSGVRLRGVVLNGAPLDVPASSIHSREDT